MAFGLDFGKDEQETKQKSKSDVQRLTESDLAQSSTSSAVGRVNQRASVTTGLGAEQQDLIARLLNSQGSRINTPIGVRQKNRANEAISGANLLTDRGARAQAQMNQFIGAIIDERQRAGEAAIRGSQTRLASAGGSALGSNVQQLGLSATSELQSRLGSEEAQLRLAAREQATNEIIAGIEGQLSVAELLREQTTGRRASEVQNFAILAEILGGAKGSTKTTGTTTQDASEDTIRKLIENLTQHSEGISRGQGESGGFGFNLGF